MLCGSLIPRDLDEAAKALLEPPAGIDFIETRLDRIGQPLPFGVLAGRRARVIVTCRHRRDGGEFAGGDADRFRILAESLRNGADLVDLELPHAAQRAALGIPAERLILSHHDFEKTPDDAALDAIVRAAARERPRWIKLATFANILSDNLRLFSFLERHKGLSIAAFCMGEKGKAGRLLARRFGSGLDYASLAGDRPTAQGQLTIAQWRRATPSAGVTDRTPLYGLLGGSLAHSLSPDLQNAFLRAAGLDGLYAPLPSEAFADGLAFAEKLKFRGLNVTIPHKDEARKAAATLGASARRARTVNTLCRMGRGGGAWKGFNTDGPGLLKVLRGACGSDWPAGRRALVLGAGGAASAVSRYLQWGGAVLFVSSRTEAAARRLAAEAGGTPVPWAERRDFRGDLVVNATPAGTFPETGETPIDGRVFRHVKAAFDLVYNPPMTRFLEEALAAGCRTVSGLEMLIEQGARSFRLWTGRRALPDNSFVEDLRNRSAP